MLGQPVLQDFGSTYLRLDCSNDPLTGALESQQISPDTNQTRDLGLQASTGLWRNVRGRLGVFLGASTAGGGVASPPQATITYGANSTGIMGGNSADYGGGGVGTFRHGQGGGANNPFKPVATLANIFVNYGDANVLNNGGGSFLGGSAYTYGAGAANLSTTNFGNFTWAYSYTSGAGAHNFTNSGPGAFLGGYSQGPGTVSADNTSGAAGAFTWVRPTANTGNTADVNNQGAGGFVQGRLQANGGGVNQLGIFVNGGQGAFAQGFVSNAAANAGNIRANGAGSFSQGRALGGTIQCTAAGDGGFAHGYARSGQTIEVSAAGAFAAGDAQGGDIMASGDGAFAMGDALSAAITASGQGSLAFGEASTAITASAANSFQFGPGVNATTDSLQVGTGVRLLGNPTALAAGQVALLIYDNDNATLEQVTVGAADSGGVGFKVLRIPN